ncbi:hypothetical protein C8R43DRAFT_1133109 [Mycena crocata]|nr:hypothetical protein C8R43DRAFT_1133109 [Mycena crocata]
MHLTETPFYRNSDWKCQAMLDTSWMDLSASQVPPDYAPFLAAVQLLNKEGCPPDKGTVEIVDQRITLGLDTSYKYLATSTLGSNSNFSIGESQVWACFLHFQVLDLILLWNGSDACESRPETSLLDKLDKKQAQKFIKSLHDWPSRLKELDEDLDKEQNHSDEAPLTGCKSTSKYPPQPARDGYGPHLGTETAPVFSATGDLAFNPKLKASQRYKGLSPDAVKSLGSTTIENVLRPLSYALNFSSLLAFTANRDLQTVHVDLKTQQQMRKLLAGQYGNAVSYMQKAMYTLIRATSAATNVEVVMMQHYTELRQKMPALSPADVGLFREILSVFRAPSIHPLAPPAPPTIPLAVQTAPMIAYTEPQISVTYPARGPLARALSIAPFARPDFLRPLVQTPAPVSQQMALRSPGIAFNSGTATSFDMDVDPTENSSIGDWRVLVGSSPPNTPMALISELGKDVPPDETVRTPVDIPDASAISDVRARVGSLPPDIPMVPISEPLPQRSENGKDAEDKMVNERGSAVVVSTDTPPPELTSQGAVGETNAIEQGVEANKSNISEAGAESPMELDNTSEPAAPIENIRRSSRQRKDASSITPSEPQTETKRKPAKRSGPKKRKLEDENEDENEEQKSDAEDNPVLSGLDSDWYDPVTKVNHRSWTNELPTFPNGVERSSDSQPISCFLPDGSTRRTFNYVSHPAAEKSEYQLLYDVQKSMDAVNERCCSASQIRFPTYTGVIPPPPTANDSYLLTLTLDQWNAMSEQERVKLWGSGLDLYIFGLESGPKTENIRDRVTKLHRLDAPVEVQVQALRVPPEDKNANVDYTSSIRTTTLRQVLEHAEKPNGLVLNALKLPNGHVVRKNPLLDSGLDLEVVAYCMTNGLEGFPYKFPCYSEMYWELIGLAHCLSLCHFDVAATRVYVSGPGEKFWIRSRSWSSESMLADKIDPRKGDITDALAFEEWDPDTASLESCEYEGCVLPAGEGVLQAESTWGHFFCASSIRSSMCVILHMVMLQHILTNAEYVGMWPVLVRICAFWLHATTRSPAEDLVPLVAYIPDLELPGAAGWMDIVYLSSVIILLPALDTQTSQASSERDAVTESYKEWRKTLLKMYVCSKNGVDLNWEQDIFSIKAALLHLAVTMVQYHRRQSRNAPEAEVFRRFSTNMLEADVKQILHTYDKKLSTQFERSVNQPQVTTRFFLFHDTELRISAL